MKKASEDAKAAMQTFDHCKMMQITMYQKYLDRHLLQLFVTNRADEISAYLGPKLSGRSPSSVLQLFHVSAHSYLKWVAGTEISFFDQPPLPPALTGIPALRQYLFDVLAPTKHHEIATHVNTWIPSFIEKVKRVVNESDRDEDFKTLAQASDQLADALINDLLTQAKRMFRKIFQDTFARYRTNTDIYKSPVEDMINVKFPRLRGPTWNKILKFRGTLPRGASKAKGLEDGCSYTKELSEILASAFHNWDAVYTARMRPMEESLRLLNR